MAYTQHTHDAPTIVEDRSGPATAVAVIVGVVVVAFLVWLFAFSGVIGRSTSNDRGPDVRIEQEAPDSGSGSGSSSSSGSSSGTTSGGTSGSTSGSTNTTP